jgi:hypothetical protein
MTPTLIKDEGYYSFGSFHHPISTGTPKLRDGLIAVWAGAMFSIMTIACSSQVSHFCPASEGYFGRAEVLASSGREDFKR